MNVVVGVGGRRGAPLAEVARLVEDALACCDLTGEVVTTLATVTRRAGEPALEQLAALLAAELVAFAPQVLAVQPVPHPSELVRRHTGLDGVAEAAVLATGATLVLPKTCSDSWTVAIGRHEAPATAPTDTTGDRS